MNIDNSFTYGAPSNWRTVIKSAKDLQTSKDRTRQGFIDQAYEKSRRAINIENHMHNFMLALENIRKVEDLFDLEDYWLDLVAAASFSIKAWGYARSGETHDQQKARLREVY